MSDFWGFWFDGPASRRRREPAPEADHAIASERAHTPQPTPMPGAVREARAFQARYGNQAVAQMARAAERTNLTRRQDDPPVVTEVRDSAPGRETEVQAAARPAETKSETARAKDATPTPGPEPQQESRNAVMVGFLDALEVDPGRAPWDALSEALEGAPKRLTERAVQEIAGRAAGLDPVRRKALDEALEARARQGRLSQLIARLRVRLAAIRPPPPPPPDQPPDGPP